MSEAAIEQRLRRICTRRKSGALKTSEDVFDRFHNQGTEARSSLIKMFKENLLNQDWT